MTATFASGLKNRHSADDEQLAEFVRALTADGYEGPERRSEPRHPLLVSVEAQAIDADGQPIGEAVSGISRDLSASGISILTATPIVGGFLWIRLTRKEIGTIEAVLEVVRIRTIGPFFETAGRFIVEPMA